ncbi:MAG: hypothetical protein ACPHY8_01455 [Patescibacteria group bacterium]
MIKSKNYLLDSSISNDPVAVLPVEVEPLIDASNCFCNSSISSAVSSSC